MLKTNLHYVCLVARLCDLFNSHYHPFLSQWNFWHLFILIVRRHLYKTLHIEGGSCSFLIGGWFEVWLTFTQLFYSMLSGVVPPQKRGEGGVALVGDPKPSVWGSQIICHNLLVKMCHKLKTVTTSLQMNTKSKLHLKEVSQFSFMVASILEVK